MQLTSTAIRKYALALELLLWTLLSSHSTVYAQGTSGQQDCGSERRAPIIPRLPSTKDALIPFLTKEGVVTSCSVPIRSFDSMVKGSRSQPMGLYRDIELGQGNERRFFDKMRANGVTTPIDEANAKMRGIFKGTPAEEFVSKKGIWQMLSPKDALEGNLAAVKESAKNGSFIFEGMGADPSRPELRYAKGVFGPSGEPVASVYSLEHETAVQNGMRPVAASRCPDSGKLQPWLGSEPAPPLSKIDWSMQAAKGATRFGTGVATGFIGNYGGQKAGDSLYGPGSTAGEIGGFGGEVGATALTATAFGAGGLATTLPPAAAAAVTARAGYAAGEGMHTFNTREAAAVTVAGALVADAFRGDTSLDVTKRVLVDHLTGPTPMMVLESKWAKLKDRFTCPKPEYDLNGREILPIAFDQ